MLKGQQKNENIWLALLLHVEFVCSPLVCMVSCHMPKTCRSGELDTPAVNTCMINKSLNLCILHVLNITEEAVYSRPTFVVQNVLQTIMDVGSRGAEGAAVIT